MSEHAWDRYHRQMLLEGIGVEGQRMLAEATVLVAGVGALGSAAADSLARAGVGTLILVDRDVVELTNLQRQLLFDEQDVSERRPKAEAARRKLQAINSQVRIRAIIDDLNHRTIDGIARGERCPDVIVDGLDNFETRFVLNDFSVKHGVPYVYAGAVGTVGMVYPVLPDRGPEYPTTPCLRCLFDGPPVPGSTATCDTAGVLGPAVAATAAIEVTTALKILLRQWDALPAELTHVDIWRNRWQRFPVDPKEVPGECPCCDQQDFAYMEGRAGGRAATLCGRNAVQLSPREDLPAALDLPSIAHALAPGARVQLNDFLLTAVLDHDDASYEMTLFANGRAIVKGTEDTAVARTIFNRYVGG